MAGKLGSVNRFMAAVLACVWSAGGLAGLAAAFLTGRRPLALAALFALGYALLWARVAIAGRLLKWNQIATPWRGR